MYTITAMVRCPLEHSELDVSNPHEAALAVEDAVSQRLLDCLGMVIVGAVDVLARGRTSAYAFTVRLVLHSPDTAATALRRDEPKARAHIKRRLEQSMRELCRRATVERIEIAHTPSEAEWGEISTEVAGPRRVTGRDR